VSLPWIPPPAEPVRTCEWCHNATAKDLMVTNPRAKRKIQVWVCERCATRIENQIAEANEKRRQEKGG